MGPEKAGTSPAAEQNGLDSVGAQKDPKSARLSTPNQCVRQNGKVGIVLRIVGLYRLAVWHLIFGSTG